MILGVNNVIFLTLIFLYTIVFRLLKVVRIKIVENHNSRHKNFLRFEQIS